MTHQSTYHWSVLQTLTVIWGCIITNYLPPRNIVALKGLKGHYFNEGNYESVIWATGDQLETWRPR